MLLPTGWTPGTRESFMELVSIGEFARRSRLSAKALRRYDELDLLRPARVDPGSGYRWYALGQLEQAKTVALLRQVGMPSAQIKALLELGPEEAAERLDAYWTAAEAGHAARRDLAGYLVALLRGNRMVMYDVNIREIPSRSLICFRCEVNADRFHTVGKSFTRRFRGAAVPRPDGIAGAPFVVFHGSVDDDSDGPVEWCWPVPHQQAEQLATAFPDLSLRLEDAHDEAFIRVQSPGVGLPQMTVALTDVLLTWIEQQQRHAAGDVRQILDPTPPAPGHRAGCDWGIPLR